MSHCKIRLHGWDVRLNVEKKENKKQNVFVSYYRIQMFSTLFFTWSINLICYSLPSCALLKILEITESHTRGPHQADLVFSFPCHHSAFFSFGWRRF